MTRKRSWKVLLELKLEMLNLRNILVESNLKSHRIYFKDNNMTRPTKKLGEIVVLNYGKGSEKMGKIKNLQSATQNDFATLEQSILAKSFSNK